MLASDVVIPRFLVLIVGFFCGRLSSFPVKFMLPTGYQRHITLLEGGGSPDCLVVLAKYKSNIISYRKLPLYVSYHITISMTA